MIFITAAIAVVAILVCAFPIMGLKQGSLLYAMLGGLYNVFNSNLNFFSGSAISSVGLVPLVAFCIVNFVLAIMGSGILQFLLRIVAFYSAYLLCAFAQGGAQNFSIVSKLPSSYPIIAGVALLLSIILIAVIHRVKYGPREKQAKEKKGKRTKVTEQEAEEGMKTTETIQSKETPKADIKADTRVNSKKDGKTDAKAAKKEARAIEKAAKKEKKQNLKKMKDKKGQMSKQSSEDDDLTADQLADYSNYADEDAKSGETIEPSDTAKFNKTIDSQNTSETTNSANTAKTATQPSDYDKTHDKNHDTTQDKSQDKSKDKSQDNAQAQSADQADAAAPNQRDVASLKRALSSLTDVEVPEFQSFPNFSTTASISSVDRGIYDVAEREAQIKRAEQEKRKAEEEKKRIMEEERLRKIAEQEEAARREAEETRKRLQNMFKPRTLMRRLNEEAQAAKDFPTYGSEIPNIDFGLSGNINSGNINTGNINTGNINTGNVNAGNAGYQSSQQTASQTSQSQVQFQTPQDAQNQIQFQSQEENTRLENVSQRVEIPVSQQIPISQMTGPMPVQDYDLKVKTTSIFKQAAEEAERDEQIEARRRQAEYELKHLDEVHNLERQRQEAEEAARRAEEELAKAKAELQRQAEQAQALQAAQFALNQGTATTQTQAAPNQAPQNMQSESSAPFTTQTQAGAQGPAEASGQDEVDEDDGISDEDMAAGMDKATAKGPDVDYVSGVAGLKSSRNGNSYLIDKQKFNYQFPPESLLKHYPISAKIYEDLENDPEGQQIVDTFKQFRIPTTLVGVQHGPTFTLYELTLAKGIKVSSVTSYSDNIAMDLSVEDVRILAPIPGKSAIGVEVPNKKRDIIGFDAMMPALKAKYYKIPMVLGKTITGDSVVIDVAKTPHLLIAGTTGSGKSVCVNGLICSVLYTKTPKEVRMILVDPKMVELSLYNGIPHLLTPVITDAKKAIKAMNFVVEEMERRMALFSSIGAKKIEEYNEKIVEKGLLRVKLPYIMVIIDEFADLMLAVGKEMETSIKRITAVARFCGIHLILATQRPSSDVITGVIKSNIPTQIAFAVSNSINSKIIIDSPGAEKLLGRGDMLYNNPESRQPTRIQGAFIDPEIEDIVEFVKTQGEPDYIDESYFEDDDDEEEDPEQDEGPAEDLFSKAWKIVSDRGEASASYLQRRLNIGYNKAANLIEQLEEAGYIGPARGSKPREIIKLYGSE